MDSPDQRAPDDLSALAWVHGELRRSLEAAHKALRRYLKEAEAARGSDIDAVDPAVLRTARTHLHQGVGALELVGLPAVADVLRASEAAVQRMIARPAMVDGAAVEVIEHTSFALLDFLGRQLAGKPVSPLLLFPQYRAALQLAGADRIHPADLWTFDWQWRELPADPAATPRSANDAARGEMETQVLGLMRDPSPDALARMSDLCADLGAGALRSSLDGPHVATSWQLAAAVFEAQSAGLLDADVHAKRLASRLLSQLRQRVRGAHDVSERLAQDLLFFCARAEAPAPGRPAPRLAAVRRVWDLPDLGSVEYETSRLGRFDPSVLALARKRVAAAKDSWSAVAGGELHRMTGLSEQFSLVGDSLQRVFPHGDMLAQALQTAVAQTVAANEAPPPKLAMEVATAILYLDASLDDGDFDHPALAERVQRLAERIDDVRIGADPQPLDGWMEELYRRVSDRQTMGSVVQELRSSLSEIEKQIDQYFRDPAQRQLLIPVPAQLSAMRGVLSVLGLDQASAAVLHMRDEVDALAQTEVDPQRAIQTGTFDRLADNLGALSFLIDMLSVQPALAKSLFRYDPETGNLSAVMGQSERVSAFAAFDEAPETLPGPTLFAPAPAPAAPAPAQTTAAGPVTPPASQAGSGLEDDDEMRGIFIEEAREVIAAATSALGRLVDTPDSSDEMTAVRRAFHTLKGSSRMVGLRDFGDAAWACEQLYNARLVASPRLDGALRQFTGEALAYLGDWTEAIADDQDRGHKAPDVARAADALREGQARLPINLPARKPADGAHTPRPEFLAPAPGLGFQLPPEKAEEPAAEPAVEAAPELADAGIGLAWIAPAEPAAPPPALPEVEPGLDFEFDLGAMDEGAPATESLASRLPDLPTEADLDLLPAPAPDAPAELPQPEAGLDFEFDLHAADFAQAPLAGPVADETQALAAPPGWPELADLPGAPAVAGPAELPQLPSDAAILAPVPEGETQEIDLGDLADLFGPEAVEPPPEPPVEGLAGPTDSGAEVPPYQAPEDISAPAEAARELPLPESQPESSPLPEAGAPVASAPEPEPEPGPSDDEQVRLIGPLRISIPLFNIYLNEADERSRRLSVELAEWAHEHEHHPVPESSAALAHSLAGSSATVGYADLSALARALEHALMRSHAQGTGRPGESDLFSAAADEIRRLLHQFAAGFLRAPDPALMERLAEHERLLPSVAPEADESEYPDLPMAPPVAAMSEPEPAAQGLDDDEIDRVDAIDTELFPIFEDEAEELLPQLQARLREWHARPGDPHAAMASMRTLHTLKGGARLTGALRLGEKAHRLESAIEALAARGDALAADIEPLLAQADAMSAAFEALRKAPPARPIAPPIAPRIAPPAAPSAAPSETPAPVQTAAGIDVGDAAAQAAAPAIDWLRFRPDADRAAAAAERSSGAGAVVRVRAGLLDRMVNQAGEVSIVRARVDGSVKQLQGSLGELTDSLERMRRQLRDIELQAETQISTRIEAARSTAQPFDPLEMDRFTRFQELTRFMAESVNDVATLQRSLQRTLQSTEDELAAQARLTRELQDDLLRTRMVEFDSLAERLHRAARLAAKDTDKQVRLNIVGGAIEIDRGVLERMIGPFEHLVRNSVAHGIELPEARQQAGKDPIGTLTLTASQVGNEVAVDLADDGAGLDRQRIRDRAVERGLVTADAVVSDDELAGFIFMPGFSTASSVTELSGRGVGLDVVRAEVTAMGGRVETRSEPGQGTRFRLLLPLTTAVTQIVMLRCGTLQVAVPSTLVEIVRRVPTAEVLRAYEDASYDYAGERMPFFWLAALLQAGRHGEPAGRTQTVVIVRSASQRVAVHVDEVVGNQEVVVKNVGPQLSRMPGLAGVTLLPSGAVALIYNPVALASLYGAGASAALPEAVTTPPAGPPAAPRAALVMVVDDSVTVRRVTQRLLVREGFRVVTAKDGMEALERLAEERPAVLLSDIEMPRMDGFDLLRNLRADPAMAGLPVIMITSRSAQKHRDHAARLGADHYLGKPYAEEELLALVARHAGADIPA